MYYSKLLFCLLLLQAATFAQQFSTENAEKFVRLLFKNSDSLYSIIHPEQLTLMNRLNIHYPEVKNKFFIGNDFESRVKEMVNKAELSYQYQIAILDSPFAKVSITIPALNQKKEYYFKDGMLVTQPYYYGYTWPTRQSKYVILHASKPDLSNSYAMNSMDNFIDNMIKVMKFPAPLIELLKTQKLHYYLCADEKELELVSGSAAKGMYYLPCDFVLSTYNNHFHEVSHFLMNFRLQLPHLYTAPFFQEGFAVGYGGRGGIGSATVLDMGAFIMYSGFIEDNDLLSKRRFAIIDASLAYPASGFLNIRLIQKLGFTQYLNLYKQYSGTEDQIGNVLIKKRDILYDEIKKEFALSRFDQVTPVLEEEFVQVQQTIKVGSFGVIKADSTGLYFYVRNHIMIRTDPTDSEYKSKLFSELAPSLDYRGEKYFIKADENEISIYNLYTNTLIANFVKSFSGQPISTTQNLRFFKIARTLLEGDPAEWNINK